MQARKAQLSLSISAVLSASLCFIVFDCLLVDIVHESKCSMLKLVSVAKQGNLSILVENSEGRFFRETF